MAPHPRVEQLRFVKATDLILFFFICTARGMTDAARVMSANSGDAYKLSSFRRALEYLREETGHRLIEVDPFKFLPLGQEIFEHARQQFELAGPSWARLIHGPRAALRVGAADYTCRLHLAPVVDEMEREHGLTIEMVPGSEAQLDRLLRDGVIDLAITSLSGRQIPDAASELFFEFQPVLLLPKDVPEFAGVTSANQILAQNPVPDRLICGQPEDGLVQVVSRTLAEMQVRWPNVQHVKTTAMVAPMVAHGRRMGLSMELPGLNEHPNVRPPVPFHGFPKVKYGAIYRQPASPAVRKLVGVLQRVAAEYRAKEQSDKRRLLPTGSR